MKLIGFLFLPFLFPAATSSQQNTSSLPDINSTRGFLEMCAALEKDATKHSQLEAFQTGYCIGWTHGFAAGVHTGEEYHESADTIFCLPKGNSFGQMVRIIRKYISDHPEEEHLRMEVVASEALRQAFPCRK